MKYTTNALIEKFDRLSKARQIEVLHSALSIMQQYNGRSTWACIFLAMGYDSTDGITWKKE